VLRGAILDIAVDIRRSSPTFGRHVAVELTSENFRQLYIPPGFAHGFSTLTADAEVAYKVTAYYSPAHDRGILWNDPDLRVDWRVDPSAAVLSEKDLRHPRLHHSKELFE
jgi:dTDP-4-dehydrorhamnose 3,5-epimerase